MSRTEPVRSGGGFHTAFTFIPIPILSFLTHPNEDGLGDALRVLVEVGDREGLDGPRVLDVDPLVRGPVALLAEHPRRKERALAGVALPRDELPILELFEEAGHRLARRPGVLRLRAVPRLENRAAVDLLLAELLSRPRDAFGLRPRPRLQARITTTLLNCMRSPHAFVTPVWISLGIWRLPAWPESCQYSSPTLMPIVAAIGFPMPRRPPLGHVGRSPSRWVTPSRVSFGASPLLQRRSPSMWWSSL